jgi:hypothetical protein
MNQAIETEKMKQKKDKYKVMAGEMTKNYKGTILSMCPQHIKKARVRNLKNKYGHQEWKPFVGKLIIELLCNCITLTCIQLVMIAMSKGESITCMCITLPNIFEHYFSVNSYISWNISIAVLHLIVLNCIAADDIHSSSILSWQSNIVETTSSHQDRFLSKATD